MPVCNYLSHWHLNVFKRKRRGNFKIRSCLPLMFYYRHTDKPKYKKRNHNLSVIGKGHYNLISFCRNTGPLAEITFR